MKWFISVLVVFAITAFTISNTDAFPRIGGGVATGGGGGGGVAFTPVHLYYMAASGCNDSNNGLSSGSPWCTPNHAVTCGDVIIAAPGSYPATGFQSWGAVSSCPSASAGIDGAGGIYFATVLCGGSFVGACSLTANASTNAMDIKSSNWAIEGWLLSSPSGRNVVADACASGTTLLHHIAVINTISYNSNQGFTTGDCALNHNVPGNGVDQFAVVGTIVQNSANDPICLAAIDDPGPANFDASAGTHVFWSQNFAIKNQQASPCGSDGEGLMFDSVDAHGYTGQMIMKNNIVYLSARYNIQLFYQAINVSAPTIKIYNNTSFAGNSGTNIGTGSVNGDINVQFGGTGLPWITSIYNNISRTNYVTGGNLGGVGYVYAALTGNTSANLTWGGAGTQNIFYGIAGTCSASCDGGNNVVAYNGGSFGTNTYVDAAFSNTTDLLANWAGSPASWCSGYADVVSCMGGNYVTQAKRSLSVIGDLNATAGGTSGKGYQLPATACQADADYPTYLKGIIYLQWNGSSITENPGLVTKPCGL